MATSNTSNVLSSNVTTTEGQVANGGATGNTLGSLWNFTLVGSLPSNGSSSFTVRVGSTAGPSDNAVVVLQNTAVSFVAAQNDVNNWCNNFPGQASWQYVFPANTQLPNPANNKTAINETLTVVLTSVNAASNQATFNVYSGAVELGSNTVNVTAGQISITGAVANTFNITFNQANVYVANVEGNTTGQVLATGFFVANVVTGNAVVTGLAQAFVV